MAKANEPLTFLSDYIYQKMTSSTDPIIKATAIRVAAHLALEEIRASNLSASDLNTSQGDDPDCLEPGTGGAPDTYEYQDTTVRDEDNTPGVIDRPDPVEEVVHGDDAVYSSTSSTPSKSSKEGATISPDAMGQGSSPTEMQDADEYEPQLFTPLNTADQSEEVYSADELPELPKGEQPQKPVEPQEPVEPVKPIEPKQAASAAKRIIKALSVRQLGDPASPDEKARDDFSKSQVRKASRNLGIRNTNEAVSDAPPPQIETEFQTDQTYADTGKTGTTVKVEMTKPSHMYAVKADKWSADVKTEWHPPEGFFEKSADSIAKGLKRESSGLKQAMSRLNFYINRAGSNLSTEDKSRLEHAKDVLHDLYN